MTHTGAIYTTLKKVHPYCFCEQYSFYSIHFNIAEQEQGYSKLKAIPSPDFRIKIAI